MTSIILLSLTASSCHYYRISIRSLFLRLDFKYRPSYVYLLWCVAKSPYVSAQTCSESLYIYTHLYMKTRQISHLVCARRRAPTYWSFYNGNNGRRVLDVQKSFSISLSLLYWRKTKSIRVSLWLFPTSPAHHVRIERRTLLLLLLLLYYTRILQICIVFLLLRTPLHWRTHTHTHHKRVYIWVLYWSNNYRASHNY